MVSDAALMVMITVASQGGGDANGLKYSIDVTGDSLALVHGLHDPLPHSPLVSPVELAESFLLFYSYHPLFSIRTP